MRRVSALVAVVALALAGCSGDDDGDGVVAPRGGDATDELRSLTVRACA